MIKDKRISREGEDQNEIKSRAQRVTIWNCCCLGFDSANNGLRLMVGAQIHDAICGAFTFLMNKPNPIIQMFYLLIAGGGFVVYVLRGMVVYIPGPFMSTIHYYTGSLLMFICYYSFYRACTDDPGVIKTPE